MTVEDLPEEVAVVPDEDDLDCGPSEDDLDEFASEAIQRAARVIDPDAFERCVPLDLDRRHDACAKAARVLLTFEAARLGVLRAA